MYKEFEYILAKVPEIDINICIEMFLPKGEATSFTLYHCCDQ